MPRPLLVTDCDEVLLHMVAPFREWVDEAHGIHFDFSCGDFTQALRYKLTGEVVADSHIWALLDEFFGSQMHRQYPIEGAADALHEIAREADVVILTNIGDFAGHEREEQLRRVGMDFPMIANSGGKGRPLARLIEEYQPSVTIFVDDLGTHHESSARHAPTAWRLQMVGEPEMAACVAPVPHAHARIDRWAEAKPWIFARFSTALKPQ